MENQITESQITADEVMAAGQRWWSAFALDDRTEEQQLWDRYIDLNTRFYQQSVRQGASLQSLDNKAR